MVDLAVSFSFYFPHTTADMFLNITYKLFTRFSFRSSSGSVSIVIGCLTFFVALVLFKASRRSKQR